MKRRVLKSVIGVLTTMAVAFCPVLSESVHASMPGITFSEDELLTAAKTVWHEAKGESADGQMAVAEVIKNRVLSPLFPGDVNSVVYQKGQFQGASRVLAENPPQDVIDRTRSVLCGDASVLWTTDVLFFRNPKKCGASSTANWGSNVFFTKIGLHSFYLNSSAAPAQPATEGTAPEAAPEEQPVEQVITEEQVLAAEMALRQELGLP